MSFPGTLLKIKRGEGWFAADRSWQSASHKLSDGAFKLFVYVSLAAERSTGRFVFRQGELAKALNKSRRSIGKYLRELEEKQLCQISLSSNQHATGTLQIRGDYWPYERSSETDALDSNRSAQRLFVEALEQMLLSRPCVSCRYSAADRQLAVQWFQQEVPLEDIEQAILLGCGRKYVSWLNGGQGQPIASLHYFSPILEEVAVSPLSDAYRAFNRWQVRRLEQRWSRAQKDSQTSKEETGWEKFSQPKPTKPERDEMMMSPKMGELPW